ncbi:hypothetical protein K440DRAFT_254380 [Wilcoxina mikolae CBS 423.85]|nr:hypothetical protein K440DRAFT_254380 [Wilcoxina mikolae CBS 423.85]
MDSALPFGWTQEQLESAIGSDAAIEAELDEDDRAVRQMPEYTTTVELVNPGLSIVQVSTDQIMTGSADMSQGAQSTTGFDRTEKRKTIEPASQSTPDRPIKRAFIATDVPEISEVSELSNRGGQPGTDDFGSDGGDRVQEDHSRNTPVPKWKFWRITNVPSTWNEDILLQKLQKAGRSLELLSQTNCRRWLFPACSGNTKTALVTTSENLEFFQHIGDDKSEHIKILDDSTNGKDQTEVYLEVDCHFYDLTPLNTPEGDIVADVVAVTGLAGHAFGSWRHRETRQMWLKDFVPQEVKGVRIMTFGYNSKLIGNTVDNQFLDYRSRFVQMLLSARRTTTEKRRIIFVGHSVGCTLILQALLACRNKVADKQIFDCTNAILFFGAPHQGLDPNIIKNLDAMIGDESPNDVSRREFIKQFEEGSNFLNTQRDDIISLFDRPSRIAISSFYEAVRTPSVRKLPSGEWAKCGEEFQMVPRHSAILHLPGEVSIPVPKNHSEMVKFGTSADSTYRVAVNAMVDCVNNINAPHGESQNPPTPRLPTNHTGIS